MTSYHRSTFSVKNSAVYLSARSLFCDAALSSCVIRLCGYTPTRSTTGIADMTLSLTQHPGGRIATIYWGTVSHDVQLDVQIVDPCVPERVWEPFLPANLRLQVMLPLRCGWPHCQNAGYMTAQISDLGSGVHTYVYSFVTSKYGRSNRILVDGFNPLFQDIETSSSQVRVNI